MKFSSQFSEEENRLRWLRHAERRGSPLLGALPPPSALPQADRLDGLLATLEARICTEIGPILSALSARKASPTDRLEDYDITLTLSYSLRLDDPEWQAFDDNLLYVQTQSLYEAGIPEIAAGFGRPVANHPWKTWLERAPCWTFLDLLGNGGLNWSDVARIAGVAVSLTVKTDETTIPLDLQGETKPVSTSVSGGFQHDANDAL